MFLSSSHQTSQRFERRVFLFGVFAPTSKSTVGNATATLYFLYQLKSVLDCHFTKATWRRESGKNCSSIFNRYANINHINKVTLMCYRNYPFGCVPRRWCVFTSFAEHTRKWGSPVCLKILSNSKLVYCNSMLFCRVFNPLQWE